jgi:hypothetical protein
MLRQSVATGKATLSYLQTNHSGSNTEDLIRTFMTLNQYRHQKVDYTARLDPMTQVSYPVFDSFHPTEKNVSGVLVTTMFWRVIFSNVLPARNKGVVCVLSNTLGEQVTYQLDGRTATLLGEGDLHDRSYNDMVVSRDIAEYVSERATPDSSSYTFVELDGGYTSYRIDVYPSKTMEDFYITSDPIIYAVAVASIFLFTSLVFVLYDFLVERRQKKVMDKAVKSTAVVTSLFPEAVHERLFSGGDNISQELSKERDVWKAASQELGASSIITDPARRRATLHDVMKLRNSKQGDVAVLEQLNISNRGGGRRRKKSKPIADKFANVTVLFADLAGFTKWSSTREPEQVFELLETLYGAFDKLAIRRQVFKGMYFAGYSIMKRIISAIGDIPCLAVQCRSDLVIGMLC